MTPETDGVEVLQGAVILELAQDVRHIVRVDAGDSVLTENVLDFRCCFGPGTADVLEVELYRERLLAGHSW